MLFLLFQVGENRYALDAGQVAEILPLVDIKQIPHAPSPVAGLFNYRGAPMPVIDMSQLTLARSAQRRLSTRIVLVHYADDSGRKRLLGLIAEKVTETMRCQPADFVDSGITSDAMSYLGPVVMNAHGLVHWIAVNKLLPPSVCDLLFKQPLESDGPR